MVKKKKKKYEQNYYKSHVSVPSDSAYNVYTPPPPQWLSYSDWVPSQDNM